MLGGFNLNHKVKQEVIQSYHKDALISYEEISDIIKNKFSYKISKSMVNRILREQGLRLKEKKSNKAFELPKKKIQQILRKEEEPIVENKKKDSIDDLQERIQNFLKDDMLKIVNKSNTNQDNIKTEQNKKILDVKKIKKKKDNTYKEKKKNIEKEPSVKKIDNIRKKDVLSLEDIVDKEKKEKIKTNECIGGIFFEILLWSMESKYIKDYLVKDLKVFNNLSDKDIHSLIYFYGKSFETQQENRGFFLWNEYSEDRFREIWNQKKKFKAIRLDYKKSKEYQSIKKRLFKSASIFRLRLHDGNYFDINSDFSYSFVLSTVRIMKNKLIKKSIYRLSQEIIVNRKRLEIQLIEDSFDLIILLCSIFENKNTIESIDIIDDNNKVVINIKDIPNMKREFSLGLKLDKENNFFFNRIKKFLDKGQQLKTNEEENIQYLKIDLVKIDDQFRELKDVKLLVIMDEYSLEPLWGIITNGNEEEDVILTYISHWKKPTYNQYYIEKIDTRVNLEEINFVDDILKEYKDSLRKYYRTFYYFNQEENELIERIFQLRGQISLKEKEIKFYFNLINEDKKIKKVIKKMIQKISQEEYLNIDGKRIIIQEIDQE